MKKWLLSLLIGGSALGGGVALDNSINVYEDKGTALEIADVSTLPEAGEIKTEVLKDQPKVVFQKWNGEVALGVRYKGLPPNTNGSRAFLTNRMEWKGAKEEVHAYPLAKGEGMEDGGFEIEIVLSSKPAKNTFDFQIDGAENLRFLYQPELTPQEIADGFLRPENVIGSYAVYHETKVNHQTGDINYATGKVYHIYRPKAFDANGAEQWADLSYTNGILTVTVPQKFLDDAVYPVKVDPTFGYTSLGATQSDRIASTDSDSSASAGRAFNLIENGTLNSLHLGLALETGTVSVDTFAVVYREDSGGSGSHGLVASVEQLNVAYTTTPAFFTFTAASEVLTADDYVLAGIGNGEDMTTVGNDLRLRADTVDTGNAYFEVTTGAGSYATRKAENPWTETAFATTITYSIYATYTASAPAAAPTASPKVEIKNGTLEIKNGTLYIP